MLIIPYLILLVFLGLGVTLILDIRVGLAERLSIAYLLGIGLFTFLIFIIDWIFNINFNLNNTFSLLISLCIILFTIRYKEIIGFFMSIKFTKKAPGLKAVIFWGFILCVFLWTLLANLYWPVADWDALAMYDFRAKLFLVDINLVHAAFSTNYFLGYPLFTSLAHLFVYQMGLNNPKFIYSLLYLSFVVIFYFSLRRNISENKSIIFTVILALTPQILSHATIAYTNLPYAVYLCIGTLYLYDWLKNHNVSFLYLSAFLVGLSTWVRSTEPFWIVPPIIVILISLKNKKFAGVLPFIIILLTITLPWKLFESYISHVPAQTSLATGTVYFNALKGASLSNFYTIAKYLAKNVFLTWGFVFVAFILAAIKSLLRPKSKNNLFLVVTLFFFALLFGGTLIFSKTFAEWKDIPDSASRMSMFFIPLMIYTISLLI